MAEPSAYNPARARRSLFGALIEARAAYGGKHPILVDGEGRVLNYDEIIRAAFALGRALTRDTKPGEAIGVLLPTGIGAVLTVYALWAFGRVPAMLNFTAGQHNLASAMKAAKVERVITAHRFIELGKFENSGRISETRRQTHLSGRRAREPDLPREDARGNRGQARQPLPPIHHTRFACRHPVHFGHRRRAQRCRAQPRQHSR